MNKKLKTLLIVLASIVLIVGVGAGGYFLIGNLSKTTVSDFKIVNAEGKPIKDTDVYMVSSSENKLDINVRVDSTGAENVSFSSSNSSVARVFKSGNRYVVRYYKPGETIITASVNENVKDSFKLTVKQDFVSNIVIEGNEDNIVTMYADGTTTEYSYVAKGTASNTQCDNSLIRFVDNYDKTVFESISINTSNKTLSVKSNLVTVDSVETITLQTYCIDENGQEFVENNFVYTINVVGYRIKDIQLLVSQDYSFKNSYVYLSETDDGTENPNRFILDGETIIDEIYLTSSIDKVYFRTRVLYTNNTYKDVSYTGSISTTPDSDYYIQINSGNANGMDYWLCVDKTKVAELTETVKPVIGIGYTDTEINYRAEKSFELIYLVPSTETSSVYYKFFNNKLYSKHVDGGVTYYEYIFWDTRYQRTDTITDADGKIIGFTSNTPECSN